MNEYEAISRHQASVAFINQWFDLLMQNIKKQTRSYEDETSRLLEVGLLGSSDIPVVMTARGEIETSAQGACFYRYSSTLAAIRLFPNQPPGWLLGDVIHFHPFARAPRRFATSFRDDKDGRFMLGAFPPLKSRSVDDFADVIFRLLTEASVFDEDLLECDDCLESGHIQQKGL